jgi:hypothetical protein
MSIREVRRLSFWYSVFKSGEPRVPNAAPIMGQNFEWQKPREVIHDLNAHSTDKPDRYIPALKDARV